MVDIIDEVNEDLRRERFNRFWQRVGGYVIAASLVIILGTVGTVVWQKYSEKRQADASEAFLAADATLKGRDYASAARQFAAVAEKNAKGIPTLASMKQGYAEMKAGDSEKALATFTQITENRKADNGLRSLARIYAAQLLVQQQASYEDIAAMLAPVAEDKDAPFSAVAREQLALAALQNDDRKTARTLMAELASDMSAPMSLRRRAQAQAANLDETEEASAADADQTGTDADTDAAAAE